MSIPQCTIEFLKKLNNVQEDSKHKNSVYMKQKTYKPHYSFILIALLVDCITVLQNSLTYLVRGLCLGELQSFELLYPIKKKLAKVPLIYGWELQKHGLASLFFLFLLPTLPKIHYRRQISSLGPGMKVTCSQGAADQQWLYSMNKKKILFYDNPF